MNANAPESSNSPQRADQIVAATRTLFLRYGYRRTSVDDIAREAGLAKATLYAHFAGKDEMFRAMIGRFRAVMQERCEAVEASAGPLEARIVDLLYAVYGTILEWFEDTAHVSELKAFAASDAATPIETPGLDLSQRLTRLLSAAAERGEVDLSRMDASAEAVAQTLSLFALGAKHGAPTDRGDFRENLALGVRLIMAGGSAGKQAPRQERLKQQLHPAEP